MFELLKNYLASFCENWFAFVYLQVHKKYSSFEGRGHQWSNTFGSRGDINSTWYVFKIMIHNENTMQDRLKFYKTFYRNEIKWSILWKGVSSVDQRVHFEINVLFTMPSVENTMQKGRKNFYWQQKFIKMRLGYYW